MASKTLLLKVADSDPEQFVFVTADYDVSRTVRHMSVPMSEDQARLELKDRETPALINAILRVARKHPV